jgi:ATP-dependent helicase/nuclease subunit A
MSAAPSRAERLATATAVQRRAAQPAASAWVSASAGTGKTKVLTDRVLSLLLSGTDPARILCLTFTKAAAAEMANRLAERLAGWASEPDETVANDLAGLLGRPLDTDLVAAARALFAQVLDTPGGMKIQTIHSFCQSLLSRFPLEAQVAPHYQVLDERTAAEMLNAARVEVLAAAQEEGAGQVASDIAEITAHLHEQSFGQVLGELIRERGRLVRLIRERGGIEAVVAAVRDLLGAKPDGDGDALVAAACADQALERMGLELAAQALDAGSDAEQNKAAVLRAWLAAAQAERAAQLADYQSLFLTQEGLIRSRLLTKAAAASTPGAAEIMTAEAGRLIRLRAAVHALTVARGTAALLRLGAAILEAYERHKRARALLDYDDLIYETRELLARPGIPSWVLFKLDGGIDHLLVDEAQDTNPEQWDVIRALTEEFFAGEGAHHEPRTLFAVGDAKQSIYSFQRARPEAFAAMRDDFAERARQAKLGWAQVDLEVSFRSTAAVLQAVDAVFARPEAQEGVLFDGGRLHHEPLREGEAGRVELWPAADPEDAADPEPWALPAVAEGLPAARTRLANLIAQKIWRWTRDPSGADDPDAWLASKHRRLEPGDVMVLVRRRNEFVEELVRALKQRDVPVSGVDRMVLTDQLAVMDLVALGRILLLPEDDLTLATVLKGPLVGFSEDQLFDLAHGRDGTLWDALQRGARRDPAYRAAFEELAALRARADYLRPFELFAEVLGPRGGRRRLLGRLGPDASDPIEEFLTLAIAYERESIPSLDGFLHWLEAGAQEVKRDLEHGGDAVRVMTVHGAKGLQAPVVFLPDTLQVPRAAPGLYWLGAPDEGHPTDTAPLVVWPIRKGYDGDAATAARADYAAARDREYRRLLYVAMTRAEDRLYVCGWNTRHKAPEGCWYRLVEGALSEIADAAQFDFTGDLPGGWAGPGWRLDCPQTLQPQGPPPAERPARARAALPDWARSALAGEAVPRHPLAPSRPSDDEPAVRSPLGTDEGQRFRRGLIVHRLLQTLPDLPPDRRHAAGRRFLERPVHGLSGTERDSILAETLAVMDAADFAPLFAPGSRAEVPVVGTIEGAAGSKVISGQIDRLAVTDDRVLIVDYKTGRQPPRREADVPAPYLRQMAAYRALLVEIYPNRRIDCFLLWTDGPHLMQLSPARLAEHAP